MPGSNYESSALRLSYSGATSSELMFGKAGGLKFGFLDWIFFAEFRLKVLLPSSVFVFFDLFGGVDFLALTPPDSLRQTDKPFKGKRHLAGGQSVSLDDIEHETLRPVAGYRVHAVLVCAARSCPPLVREAFRGDVFDKQLDERMRVWLGRDDLNRFDPQSGRAEVSSVFKFFGEDFGNEGGLPAILARFLES